MICVIAFCKSDISCTLRLLNWIRTLGGCKNHDVLLVADCGLQWTDALEALKLAKLTFKAARLIPTEKSCDFPWPVSANLMFMTAARAATEPFLWLEPDAIPLKPKWLEAIDAAYQKCCQPFMGSIMESVEAALPKHYLSGIAVYPTNAAEIIKPTLKGNAWDMDSAHVVMPQAAHTDLIHNLWGESGKPPTFAKDNIPGTNVFSLKQIKPEAVLFHRNKDGSLISLLSGNENQLLVVIPFCGKDVSITMKNLQWMEHLGGAKGFDLLLIHDQTVNYLIKEIDEVAARCFRTVQRFKYNCSVQGWPQAPNFAFRTTAHHMTGLGRPWLWLEPDAVPLKKEWLSALQREYVRHNKPFMGPIVPNMGHMNGVGIYPSNTPSLIPRAMRSSNTAWDSDMRDEMINKCHNASHLIQHCWGIVNGCAHPHGGELPHFKNAQDLKRWLLPSAVLFHRCKDGSLIDQLSK